MVIHLFIWTIAYLLGSIPFGVLFARARNINLRNHGSGNIGATNVSRVLGNKLGALTFLGDTLKGWIAVSLASSVFNDPFSIAVTGFMVFVGHLFSVFLKFKGGKGVATGLGVFLNIAPLATLASTVVFAFTLFISKFVSLSSMVATITLPIFSILFKIPSPYVNFSAVIAIIIIFKHHKNIIKLIKKTEPRFPKNRN